MSESKVSRTLVKSTPELWSEVSNAASLQRHMDQFGEIRITKLEPESTVAWEGEHTRGTIMLEASGWGTKVSLTAERLGTGGVDGREPGAAGQAEPGSPVGVGAPPDGPVEPAPPERLDPPQEIKAEMPDRTIPPERDWLDTPTQRPPWTRRLAEAFRRWFGAPTPQDGDPVAHAATPVTREPEQPASPVAPAAAVELAPREEPPLEPENASTAALDAALDSLGQAHHRPYSRA